MVCDFYVKAPPVPIFWATLVEVWSAVFLVDIATYLFCRPTRFALPGYVCRTLLYDGIFWLTKLGPAIVANIVKKAVYWIITVLQVFSLSLFRGYFNLSSPFAQGRISWHYKGVFEIVLSLICPKEAQ